MSEHPNVALSRRGYEAFGSGDMATLTEMIAENCVWHIGGRSRLAGDYEGREAIFGLFAELAQGSEGTMRVEVHDILANDTHATVMTTITAGGSSGKTLSVNTVDSSHVVDGQVTEFWSFGSDQYAWDEYWGS